MTQTAVAPISHHSIVINSMMITNIKIDSSEAGIILINLILGGRLAVLRPGLPAGAVSPYLSSSPNATEYDQ